MDRITESLLGEFSKSHEIENLPEDKRFEWFSAFSCIRRLHARTFDVDDVVVGGHDTGIDAIAIIVNNVLITDLDEVAEIVEQNGYVDASFVFVQAERSRGFDSSKIGNFEFGVRDFFSDAPTLIRGDKIVSSAEIMRVIYDKHSGIFREKPSCTLYYVTTGVWNDDANLCARRAAAIDSLKSTGIFQEVEFNCFGADEIQKAYKHTKNAISRQFIFKDRIDLPETEGVTKAFLGFVPMSAFLSIIADESGKEILGNIFYDNVRDWQDYNPVNTGIRVQTHKHHQTTAATR